MFNEWFKSFRKPVEDDIRAFFHQYQSVDYHPWVTDVYHDLVEYILRAGRMAASLALATYKGISRQEINADTIRIGTSLEIYGFGVLLHDDVFDCDTIRIQKDAFHIIYEKKARKANWVEKKVGRFGESMAVIAGNILHNLALIALNTTKLKDYYKRLLIENLTYGFVRLNESQIVDIVFEYEMPTSKQWYDMARKRAASHVGVCMAAGGIVADWEKNQKDMLLKAAAHLGYMFDIRDDLLDTFAEKGTIFQPPRRDLEMRKKPLHFCFAWERADEAAKEILKKYVIQPDKTFESTILDILRDYGLEPTLEKLREHAKYAVQSFEEASLTPEAQAFFIQIVENSLKAVETL
ncbi:MAG: polyprenyl synthetase family protein [Candidatus Aminicenantes bacterium]|jgi:geranylgeranyl diphosphate synthase type II